MSHPDRYIQSIPALTGEPRTLRNSPYSRSVYPRAYGGTALCYSLSSPLTGLSPRLRGNPGLFATPLAAGRSIPAPTGEPYISTLDCVFRWVYPRAYGGTGALIISLRI